MSQTILSETNDAQEDKRPIQSRGQVEDLQILAGQLHMVLARSMAEVFLQIHIDQTINISDQSQRYLNPNILVPLPSFLQN